MTDKGLSIGDVAAVIAALASIGGLAIGYFTLRQQRRLAEPTVMLTQDTRRSVGLYWDVEITNRSKDDIALESAQVMAPAAAIIWQSQNEPVSPEPTALLEIDAVLPAQTTRKDRIAVHADEWPSSRMTIVWTFRSLARFSRKIEIWTTREAMVATATPTITQSAQDADATNDQS